MRQFPKTASTASISNSHHAESTSGESAGTLYTARAGTRRDGAASASACAKALEEVARERDRLVRLYTTGRVGDAEYDALAGELEDREAGATAELDRARREAEEAGAREDNRRAILEAYGTGLRLGLYHFPAHLRRQVYGASGLTAFVSPDGTVEIEGSFDADVIRLTREVEEYAVALREAEERIDGYEAQSTEDGWEHLERELLRVRDGQTPRRWSPAPAHVQQAGALGQTPHDRPSHPLGPDALSPAHRLA